MIAWKIKDEYAELRVSGKLTDHDYREILPVLGHILTTRDKPKFLIILDHFEGWELSALWTDLRYDLEHAGEFGRMAVIGETSAAKWLTQFSNIFFPSEILYFGKDEEDLARSWLGERNANYKPALKRAGTRR